MRRISVVSATVVAACATVSVGVSAQASPGPVRGHTFAQPVHDSNNQPTSIDRGSPALGDQTKQAPPAVATAGATATSTGCTYRPGDATAGGAYYCRAGAEQTLTNADGAYMSTQVQSPVVATGDYHSLAEMAVESLDQKQIVEIGWRISPNQYGDQQARLFVYHWVNGVGTCYSSATDPCGYVSQSSTIKPGMTLPYSSSTTQFEIDYSGGLWWLGYNGTWFGYLPGSLWNGTFTKASLVQLFGEVSSTKSIPCTNMGNGYLGTSGAGVIVTGIGYFNTTETPNLTPNSDNASLYNSQVSTTHNTFQYGGSGGRTTSACTTP